MSLILLEGFDLGDSLERIQAYHSNASVQAVPRTGTNSMRVFNNGYFRYIFNSSQEHARFIVGFGFQAPTAQNLTDEVVGLFGDDFATRHIHIDLTAAGRLQVKRSTTILGQTDVDTISAGEWHYIELEVLLSDTVGEVKLRVDGKTPGGWTDLTNADTKNGGTATVFNGVKFEPNGGTNPLAYYDDIYVANGAGTVNNGLLGDVRVYPLLPNGNGNYSQLVGQDADSTDNYLNVDETTPDGDTTYNESSTDGEKDTYTFEDLPITTGDIKGVQVSAYARKDEAAAKSVRIVHRRGTTDVNGDDKTLQTTFNNHDQIWDEDGVATAAWTITNVNSSEFGVEVRP